MEQGLVQILRRTLQQARIRREKPPHRDTKISSHEGSNSQKIQTGPCHHQRTPLPLCYLHPLTPQTVQHLHARHIQSHNCLRMLLILQLTMNIKRVPMPHRNLNYFNPSKESTQEQPAATGSTPTKTLDKDLNSERKAFEELKIRRNRQTQQNLKMEATWSSISSSTVQCFIDRDDISPIVVSLIIARPLLQMQIENLLENMAKDKMNECNLQKRSHHHLQTTKA